eukprot:UN12388
MGQQASIAYTFCCTACSACPCCTHTGYDKLDKLGLMNNSQGVDYQSNGLYNNATNGNDNKIDDNNIAKKHKHADERTKFRAFIIAYNKQYGYLLLRCYKKGKDLHYQLPGGHIDKSELHACSFEEAAKVAAKRELFEETGLDVDDSRLKFLKLGIKNRVYFQLLLHETDSLKVDDTTSKSLDEAQDFYLQLSSEHNGFQFEKDINCAIQMIQKHSGGKNSDALTKYAKKAKHEKKHSLSQSHESHSDT